MQQSKQKTEKRYRVTVWRTIIEEAIVEVLATDDDDAEERALVLAENDDPSVVWECTDETDEETEDNVQDVKEISASPVRLLK